ncbi:MAG: hypothetical protein QOD06_753 [Candidatus Binatota bacterium]|jgi:uncharacterized protein YcbK (DUF882 family)|nr:hypothetical protein [Candidatus Binatota bacterium]
MIPSRTDPPSNDGATIARRQVLRVGAAAAIVAMLPGRVRATAITAAPAGRTLSLSNVHTGERLRATYWEGGRYLPDALHEINHCLRDYRNGQCIDIDVGLLDLLHELRASMDTRESFTVISGYRSPATNEALRRAGHGVAAQSLHTRGMAIDVRLPGRSLTALRRSAIALRRGGVGYYPADDFVHVDVGRVRYW